MQGTVTRRSFMLGAATAAASLRVLGANGRIRLSIIGSGGRGQYLMRSANQVGNVDWAAAADIWDLRCDQAEQVAGAKIEVAVPLAAFVIVTPSTKVVVPAGANQTLFVASPEETIATPAPPCLLAGAANTVS